jgi:membrane protein implicated in regulation of membrane protease activity
MSFLEQAEFWHWWIAGVVLMIVEVFVPGAFFLWLGLAAGVVGLVLLVFSGTSWEVQFLIWAVLSVAAVVGSRLYLRRHPIETDRPTLNRRGEQYIGRHFTLEEPMVNGLGKIRVDDSTWKIEGPEELPAGRKIRVIDVEGTVLKVEAA